MALLYLLRYNNNITLMLRRPIMNRFIAEYKSKLVSADTAVQIVKSGDWIDFGFILTIPVLLDEALARRKNELTDIKIRSGLASRPLKILEVDPNRETFTYNSWHFSGYERKLHEQGLCNYIPLLYRNEPAFYRNELQVDVAFISLPPMDKHGYFNFSVVNSATRAILDTAKHIIVEINPFLPIALGGKDECIHISEIDQIVEGGDMPLAQIPPAVGDSIDLQVARLIVEDIVDGSTLQLGIGGLPNTVGSLIAESDVKDLGMHTEMLVDAYLNLYNCGKLTNRRKNIDRHKGVWTFAMGSQALYDWIDNNPGLASMPVNYTNDPAIIAQLDNFISVNSCLEVDLYGQVASEASGSRHISGTGGQNDFMNGAYRSRGGKSYICFRSTYTDKKGKTHSRIRPTLPLGNIVTAPRTHVHYLVTEWGKVNLAGSSTWERAEKIISIAHPDFRDELIKEAESLNIWRKTGK